VQSAVRWWSFFLRTWWSSDEDFLLRKGKEKEWGNSTSFSFILAGSLWAFARWRDDFLLVYMFAKFLLKPYTFAKLMMASMTSHHVRNTRTLMMASMTSHHVRSTRTSDTSQSKSLCIGVDLAYALGVYK
jgi:hypothetical protein